jgi:hypothetical protein
MRPICLLPRHLNGCNYSVRLQLSCFFSCDLTVHLQSQYITFSVHSVTRRFWLVLALCTAPAVLVTRCCKATRRLARSRNREKRLSSSSRPSACFSAVPSAQISGILCWVFYKNLHRKSKFGCNRATITDTLK